MYKPKKIRKTYHDGDKWITRLDNNEEAVAFGKVASVELAERIIRGEVQYMVARDALPYILRPQAGGRNAALPAGGAT